MKEVIIATKNAGKLIEFQSILSQYDLKAISLLDLEDSPEVEETGSTFEENAVLKAEAISKLYGKMAIADDSGLSVDYLGGEPGVYSAQELRKMMQPISKKCCCS
jgi:XTP/dITP diphosphohydrolase